MLLHGRDALPAATITIIPQPCARPLHSNATDAGKNALDRTDAGAGILKRMSKTMLFS